MTRETEDKLTGAELLEFFFCCLSFEDRVQKRAFQAGGTTPTRHKFGKKKGKCRHAYRTPQGSRSMWWEPWLDIGVRSRSQTH